MPISHTHIWWSIPVVVVVVVPDLKIGLVHLSKIVGSGFCSICVRNYLFIWSRILNDFPSIIIFTFNLIRIHIRKYFWNRITIRQFCGDADVQFCRSSTIFRPYVHNWLWKLWNAVAKQKLVIKLAERQLWNRFCGHPWRLLPLVYHRC